MFFKSIDCPTFNCLLYLYIKEGCGQEHLLILTKYRLSLMYTININMIRGTSPGMTVQRKRTIFAFVLFNVLLLLF